MCFLSVSDGKVFISLWFISRRQNGSVHFLLQRHKHALNQIEWVVVVVVEGEESLPMTTGREKVHQALWQPFTSTQRYSFLINRQSILRLPLMARGRGGKVLCLDLSERRDLKVVHRVLERELKYFSSLWQRMVVLQNKLRLSIERTAVQHQKIWQLWKTQVFNWLVHDNSRLLSGILISVAVQEKKVTKRKVKKKKANLSGIMSHRWPGNVRFSETRYLDESLT